MSVFKDKHILLGVSGGVAAYKSAELLRMFVTQGAQVQVVMTAAATEFVSPLIFQALSARPVRCELFDAEAEAGMGHIELARWADLIVIAPATANSIAKIAFGLADNLLMTLILASSVSKILAPAMNQQMWRDEATQSNVSLLMQRGYLITGPASGEQACGDIGPGRMEDPQNIVAFCKDVLLREQMQKGGADTVFGNLENEQLLKGRKLVITAGPTLEDIDPVRFLTNRSSGKMGYAVAQAAVEAGAEVILVSGPVALKPPVGCLLIAVRGAREMHQAVMQVIDTADIFVATAAVADYRPAEKKPQKIKKMSDTLSLELVKNPDILADVAAHPKNLFTLGFAAETANLAEYATRKLKQKKLDMIAANMVGENKGFDQEHNELHLFWHEQDKVLTYAPKIVLARQLICEIAAQIRKQ